MRHALLSTLLVLSNACTSPNSLIQNCIPGEQKACPCPGGAQGAQACNASGTGYDVCMGCGTGGGGGEDMAVADLSVDPNADLAGADFAIPPGSDLAGVDFAFPPGTDLLGVDFSVPPPDLATLVDLASTDLTGTGGTPCAVAMFVLDRSGSMDSALGPGSAQTRLDAARKSIHKAVAAYGGRIPFGLTTFENSAFAMCDDGVEIKVEPALGTASSVQTALAATIAGGGTNSGNAVKKVAADPAMHDAMRQGSFVILITDGEPNCETSEPSFTLDTITAAASGVKPIKTFVVGLGELFGNAELNLNGMAQAGQTACTSGFCQGKKFYPASSEAQLDAALDLILNKIVGSAPGGSCGAFACFPSGASCGAGLTCCGQSSCKNLSNDPANCGECGTACFGGAACTAGKCPPVADMSPPPSDLADNRPPCTCNKTCLFGQCVGKNCCLEDQFSGLCTADGGTFDCRPTP